MKKWLKVLLITLGSIFGALLLIFVLLMIFTPEEWLEEQETASEEQIADSDETWAVYAYMCGSDLESEHNAVSLHLNNMMQVRLPDNVKMVVETGGSKKWSSDWGNTDYLTRHVYTGTEKQLIEQLPSASMGDSGTLEDFLLFCRDNYPADHTMLILWNHGAGSLGGIAFDELYNNDSLSLTEIHDALSDVYRPTDQDKPLELVVLDACLMASVETASVFSDYAEYMVGSEESMYGYNIGRIMYEIAGNPAIETETLGKIICDNYVEEESDDGKNATTAMSVIDLDAIDPLLQAYQDMGDEALRAASRDESFLVNFQRNTRRAENYGGNSDEEEYTDMVDLGDMVRKSKDMFPESSERLLKCLDDCVVYKVNGEYRAEATGLSCYYSLDSEMGSYMMYEDIAETEPFKYLYGYMLRGHMSYEGEQYLKQLGCDNLLSVQTTEITELEGIPLKSNEQNEAVLELGTEALAQVEAIYNQLLLIDTENDMLFNLGYNNDLTADFESGVFTSTFDDTWGTLDGHIVYMELVDEQEDYEQYAIPILLNGEHYNLRVAYNYDDASYEILGARRDLGENGKSDKELRMLEPGDEITTILMGIEANGGEDFERYLVDTFTVAEDTAFERKVLGYSNYASRFLMKDVQNRNIYSDFLQFQVY
ncbi:MAG: clostripain-related cysteine peptidase [bacterium]|nr:clostripain-related cysteine peptidase [bacterium]